jgi:septal ring factor EnvC (AmiA/AmiB activator)
LAASILAMAIVIAPGAAAADPAADSTADKKQKQLDQIRRRIDELRTSLEGDRDQQSQLREDLRATEISIGKISRTLRELRDQQRLKLKELQAQRARRAEAEAALDRQRQLLEQQVIAAYKMGRQGRLKIVFNQENLAAIGRMLTYYDYFSRARITRIADIDQKLRDIRAIEETIARQSDAIGRLQEDQSREMESLAASRDTRRQLVARLEAEIHTKEQRLDSLMKDERNLSELVNRLRETWRDLSIDVPDNAPFSRLKGRLPWPVQGKVAARFGASRKAESLTWRGIVIDAEEGQEVRAVYDGTVVFADWMRGFGLMVIIDHGNGYMSLYGHNQSLYKSVGDSVRKGEVIATVGDSGGSEVSGLYFEIRHNGIPDDPAKWCRSGG